MSQYDDDNDLDEVMGVLNTASNLYETATNVTYNNEKLKSAERIKNATLLASIENAKNQADYTTKNTLITQEIKDSKANITTILNKMQAYDTHVQDWYNLDDKDTGPFGQQLLSDIGVEYGENLQYSVEIADDATQQLENNQNLLSLTRKIENDLTSKYNDILSLQKDYLKVRDDGIYKGLRELSEQETYIKENPQRFAASWAGKGQDELNMYLGDPALLGLDSNLEKVVSFDIEDEMNRNLLDTGSMQDFRDRMNVAEPMAIGTPGDFNIAISDLKDYQQVIDGIADTTVTDRINAKYPAIKVMQDAGMELPSSADWERNPLAKAFVSQKKTTASGIDYGYLPDITQAKLKTAGYDYKTGRTFMEGDRDEIQLNTNAGFKMLGTSLSSVRGEPDDKGLSWLKKAGIDANFLSDLSGAKDLWNDPNSAGLLKDRLEVAIVKMFDEATEAGFGFGLTTNQEKLRKEWGFDTGIAITNPLFRNKVVDLMHERYLGDQEISGIDPNTNKPITMSAPTQKTLGGRLNIQYANDGMYHESGARFQQEEYGTTARDDVYHDLIFLWKQLEDAYPTQHPVVK